MIALPLKLSAPDGSTILLKLLNGVENVDEGRLGWGGRAAGRPGPRPADAADDGKETCGGDKDGSMSRRLKPGLFRLAENPPPRCGAERPRDGGNPPGDGRELGDANE